MFGTIVLPEQPKNHITKKGFQVTVDTFQNAIVKIEHDKLDWHKYQDEILDEMRGIYPDIEIWKTWHVVYSSPKGEHSVEVQACQSDLKQLFPTLVRAEDAA